MALPLGAEIDTLRSQNDGLKVSAAELLHENVVMQRTLDLIAYRHGQKVVDDAMTEAHEQIAAAVNGGG